MKVQKMMIRLAVCVLLTIVSLSRAEAQYNYKFSDELGTYKVLFTPKDKSATFTPSKLKPLTPKTHEIRLSLTLGGTDDLGVSVFGTELNYIGNLPDYPQRVELGPSHWYAGTLEYGYWIKEWLSIGVAATWNAGVRNIYDFPTQQLWLSLRRDYISILPIARFAWLRRGIVQLYSSVGLGLGIERWVTYIDNVESNYSPFLAYDIKLVGLSVGRKWFGFVELGSGSRGVVNVGFGCRINTKNK